jgi:D-alanine-D-alanine ligase
MTTLAQENAASTLIIVAGGQSPEHDISIRSAKHLFEDLHGQDFPSVEIQIVTQGGIWLNQEQSRQAIMGDHKVDNSREAGDGLLSADVLTSITKKGAIIMPLIHGATGEDGRLQGFLDILGVPYIGCGVRSSAVCMDKAVFKAIASKQGLPQTQYITMNRNEWQNDSTWTEKIQHLRMPLVVKPSSLGSSIGVAKVASDEELRNAVEEAFKLDPVCIIEAAVRTMWEFEIGAIGPTFLPRLSCIGKIVNKQSFVGYEDKYGAEVTNEFEVPAQIATPLADKVRALAKDAYAVFGCEGMARVDFLYDVESDELFLNEINTIPGFTSVSLFPELWQKSGMSLTELLQNLMRSAKLRNAC